jgi:ABC-type Fe3+ transport system substrate-binding protein
MGADYEAKVLANLVSNEANVRAVLSKVQLGEGDAGIVYASDVTPAVRDQVRIVGIPTGLNVIAEYPVGVVQGAANATGAQQFIAYLLSPAGQAILQKWGFAPVIASNAPLGDSSAQHTATASSHCTRCSDPLMPSWIKRDDRGEVRRAAMIR